MSLSDWLHKPATRRSVGIPLALVAAGAVLLWLWPDAPPFPQRQTIESYEAFSETIDPECSAVLANPQQSSAVPRQVDECAEKAAIQKKGYRDLAQSVRASNATEEAAWLSYLQTRAAIVGAAFVVLTLAATAWAAWAAADAARIADKSAAAAIKAADAAEAAVAVASKTAERQLRAYISIDLDTERKPKVNTDLIEIDFKVTNRGQTPAYGMFHWNRVQIRPFPESGPLRRDRGGKLLYGRTDVASGAKFGITAYYGQGIGVEELIALQKGQKRIYLFGAIYFRDAFERRRYLRYCYTLRVNQDGSIPGPELYHRHNESN